MVEGALALVMSPWSAVAVGALVGFVLRALLSI